MIDNQILVKCENNVQINKTHERPRAYYTGYLTNNFLTIKEDEDATSTEVSLHQLNPS